MTFRLEEKLNINTKQLSEFVNWIKKNYAKQIFPAREIESIYFENYNNDMYLDSEEGCVPRKKIRIRNYPNQKIVEHFFEVKISSVEGRFKNTKKIDLGEFKKIFPNVSTISPLNACEGIIEKLNKRVLVLKGPSTFIVTTTGRIYILNNGNALLATAGSGDVLSGIILGFLSQGYSLDTAAILGVYTHGLCSQNYFKKYSKHSMLAHDIIKLLPSCLNEIYL